VEFGNGVIMSARGYNGKKKFFSEKKSFFVKIPFYLRLDRFNLENARKYIRNAIVRYHSVEKSKIPIFSQIFEHRLNTVLRSLSAGKAGRNIIKRKKPFFKRRTAIFNFCNSAKNCKNFWPNCHRTSIIGL
jgi:hypothetical protein